MAIPLPGMPGQAFLGGLDVGSNLLNRLMQQRMAQQQEQRLGSQFQQEMGLRGQQEERLGAMLPFQQRLAELQAQKAEMDIDPQKKMEYFRGLLGGALAPGGELSPEQVQMVAGEELGPQLQMGLPAPAEIQPGAPLPPSRDQIEQLFSTPRGQLLAQMAGIPEPASLKARREIEIAREKQLARARAAGPKEEGKLIARQLQDYRRQLPRTERLLDRGAEVRDVMAQNPHLFGAGWVGTKWGDAEWRARNLKTPEDEKNFGKIDKFLKDLVGTKAGELSTRGLQVAFRLAEGIKPSLNEAAGIALSKMDEMIRDLGEAYEDDLDWYTEYGGKPWRKRETAKPERVVWDQQGGVFRWK